MTAFSSADGTRLAYHRHGDTPPLVLLPGGPMVGSAYLAGLAERLPSVRLDLRGTGASEVPADPTSYRCDRQVDDVEALRQELGLERLDLLGHSAGGTLALLYALRHPDRVARLVLAAPSPRPVGILVTDDDRREVARQREGEPWFADAYAGFEGIWAGELTDENFDRIQPFMHGRWDSAARAAVEWEDAARNDEAAGTYYAPGCFDPAEVRAALCAVTAPVLLLSGGVDPALPPHRAAEYAALFPNARHEIQPGAGHTPWRDDPEWTLAALTAFLA
ncbi:alpha/beta fold hydrolase [Hamadaea tsunoensis]|uniref:alpha/beta fold hydrolase n=1 Tax=Hamadaea tsunoensis TaxID=53368 RepID=UPI0003FF1C0D|nr:alpha/beta hydrolase [Hamadaea tsunoensis]